MRIPKRYGQSRVDRCPFCNKQSTSKNRQEIPVCRSHIKQLLILKCQCGEHLDILNGKWGPYCQCMKCGNMNFKKALEINPKREVFQEESNETQRKYSKPKFQPKEIVVSSKDLDFLY